MNKYIKLIAFDVIMAVIIVVLYSPGLLNLRPTDPSILRAGLSIIFAVVIVVAIVWYNYDMLRGPKYEHLDTSGELDSGELSYVLGRYKSDPVVGSYASSALDELEQAARKKKSLYDIVSSKFEKHSLTWDKFVAVIDSAVQTVNKNTALLANRVQAFDVEDYTHMKRLMTSGDYVNDSIPDELQVEKWNLMQTNLGDMRNIVAANENLLLELDKFAVEISQLESSANSEENNRMIEEVRTLVEETKYYR